MKKKIIGGYYNFTIKNTNNTNNTKNMKFISSDSSIIFFNNSKNTFEETYNDVIMTKFLSLPFFFEKHTNKKYYILFYSQEYEKVYLQILDETDKKFVVEPIITKEEYFFGKTCVDRLQKNNNTHRTFESLYTEWEKELLEALEKKEITPEQIHNFLFRKNINTIIIKNKNSLNAHTLKLENKRNPDYYNYITKQIRVPREMIHYYHEFYKRNPVYDLRPT